MRDPQVSVVMPVYNAECYVAEAIESILSQTYTTFEFLIFNDGSTDRSLDILKTYTERDERVHVFSGPHKGYVPWLNEGLRVAQGQFIARMDADDISLPLRFDRQVEYLRRHPECVVVGCDLLQIDSDGDPLSEVRHDVEHQGIEANLLRGGFEVIAHPTCMMRRSALLAVGGYREEFESIEDFDLWFRLAEQGLLANLPEVLFNYRVHHANVIFTQVERQKQVADRIISEARLRRGLPPLGYSIWSYTPPSPVGKHQEWAWQAAGSGHHRTALKHAVIAMRMAPFSPQSWLALCFSIVPRTLRWFLKQTLICAGLRRGVR